MNDRISENGLATLVDILGMENVRRNEPMKAHTTMEVGGPAALFLTPADPEEIAGAIHVLKKEKIPFYILGKGSNIICRDEGYDGAILSLTERFRGYRIETGDGEEVLVSACAGTLNKDFSDAMITEGLAGFEFASGIPGSIGGAAAMNAGAYDGEMKGIIRDVTLMEPDGRFTVRSKEEMEFSYRHSYVSGREAIVLAVTFALKKDDPQAIQERVEELTRRRREKQPLEYPSCGSTFKRPEGHFAGKLISDAGLKGYRHGGAQVSEKHAGFVINRDHASSRDVLELIDYIKAKVLETQGVQLECEVKIL